MLLPVFKLHPSDLPFTEPMQHLARVHNITLHAHATPLDPQDLHAQLACMAQLLVFQNDRMTIHGTRFSASFERVETKAIPDIFITEAEEDMCTLHSPLCPDPIPFVHPPSFLTLVRRENPAPQSDLDADLHVARKNLKRDIDTSATGPIGREIVFEHAVFAGWASALAPAHTPFVLPPANWFHLAIEQASRSRRHRLGLERNGNSFCSFFFSHLFKAHYLDWAHFLNGQIQTTSAYTDFIAQMHANHPRLAAAGRDVGQALAQLDVPALHAIAHAASLYVQNDPSITNIAPIGTPPQTAHDQIAALAILDDLETTANTHLTIDPT